MNLLAARREEVYIKNQKFEMKEVQKNENDIQMVRRG